ncbi:glycosyltransferase involved in cell wall biosynthesis [Methanohalophilus euhalobius]|uniref:Glycosyltransferase involved in cell wall biosynthesis n=1 Tax=Methanohalophilus euhalobius TaxID=51203 RepID=A0A285F510_9EURY|nr:MULTISPECIES: glycosyltransferase family 2 protein [Methanohalophilus]ODV50002.1 MAG: dolichyl-phosphate beta-D-mannosyltransferase [Methanohalophilus sp. 2-GBenrich]RXG34814.1 dolichyl-phosphate beta-D-mannosyltransferase [Methanohalophilus sp. WG1-DM]TCL12304.1 glycosyltransferase involved in cell wall biosynthesis [Methanohalophilus euhalobius]SNY06368.1 Glycosyltransferase involved in cell wall bisynthesis [Methanohalophilus euhalobius]
MPKLSVVMPSMNEEKTIGICITKAKKVFEKCNLEGEIIVVDNSSDMTPEIAASMGARVISGKEGYGNAYMAGLSSTTGDYIAIADSDNTYDLEELTGFMKYLINGEADFVIGSRLRGNIQKGAMPWLHQYIGNPLLTRMLNLLFKTDISDAHCGMRAFTREALDKMKLKTHGMEFASEMVIEASYNDLRIKEVPISYHVRYAPSKLRSLQDGWRHVRFMMLYQPLKFMFVPGFLVFLVGFLLTALSLLQGNVVETRLHSFILGGMLLIVGGQILATGSYMKAYGLIHGIYHKKNDVFRKMLSYHSLEKELFIGSGLLILSFILGLWIVYTWASTGYGSLSEVEIAIVVMVLAALGLQMIFGSIFLSVMLLGTDIDR